MKTVARYLLGKGTGGKKLNKTAQLNVFFSFRSSAPLEKVKC